MKDIRKMLAVLCFVFITSKAIGQGLSSPENYNLEEDTNSLELLQELVVDSAAPDCNVTKNAVIEGLYSKLFDNDTRDETYPSCPVLYTRIGTDCVSFFTPAKIPWAEAQQFCISISGDLITFNDAESYISLMEYIREAEFTTDFWTGGKYSASKNAWTWAISDTQMKMGSPYWTVKYTSQCIPRSPQSATCYYYQQTPQQNADGWCAAMTYEQYFYMSDAPCSDLRSPLCLHKSNPKSTL